MTQGFRAPVDDMQATAARWGTVATDLNGATPPEIDIVLWPSAVSTGELHAATSMLNGRMILRITNNAMRLSSAATGYQTQDATGVDAMKKVGDTLGALTGPLKDIGGAVGQSIGQLGQTGSQMLGQVGSTLGNALGHLPTDNPAPHEGEDHHASR